MTQILRSGGCWSFRSNICLMSLAQASLIPRRSVTYLGHSTIDHKISTINETAFITGQEHHGLSLLDGLTKPTSREVDLTTVTFRLVIAEPILQ